MYPSPLISSQLIPADLTRLQFEMDLARQVQFSLLPKIPPCIPGLDLSGFSQPASHVGGDFYDFVVNPDQSLTFFIGDVSGKGMPAAMLMTMTRAILRAEISSPGDTTPETILQNANAKLLPDFTETGTFATVLVGQYYPASKEILIANAGHSAVIFRSMIGQPQLLDADGIPLGIQEKNLPKNHRLSFAKGDLLVVTTDGLYEARNSHGKIFGIDRLVKQTHKLSGQSAKEISESLLKRVRSFSGIGSQMDDQTVLVLRGTGQ